MKCALYHFDARFRLIQPCCSSFCLFLMALKEVLKKCIRVETFRKLLEVEQKPKITFFEKSHRKWSTVPTLLKQIKFSMEIHRNMLKPSENYLNLRKKEKLHFLKKVTENDQRYWLCENGWNVAWRFMETCGNVQKTI